MSFGLCKGSTAASWMIEQGLPWQRLAGRGPLGYQKYARVRFIPDPSQPGQRINDVSFEQQELRENEQIGVVLDILSRYTRTPDDCYFCMWAGWGSIAVDSPPNFAFPNRDYWMLHGTLADYGDWNSDNPARWPYGDAPDPAFIWPADRAWCVTNDVDPHFATIGAESAAIEEIVTDQRIDAVLDNPEHEPPHWA
ncbi:hypothetical protein [Rhodococcoides yunnanense]|uniref:hypothetical protein n=1 Tax=Rhodococcoides yunnanense TaxID=278209 RepID=UPI00093486B6|nr:hypothetical protein [Rhodococcus yunnanensis]